MSDDKEHRPCRAGKPTRSGAESGEPQEFAERVAGGEDVASIAGQGESGVQSLDLLVCDGAADPARASYPACRA
jgi:hypothetical protein